MQIKNNSVGGHGIPPTKFSSILLKDDIHFGHKFSTIKETQKSIKFGKRTIDIVRKFFYKKKSEMPLVSDIFVVKNNIIKDNTKNVTNKIVEGSTSYNTKKILSQNPNSLSNVQKVDIKKDLDYQLHHHQISQREYEQIKRKVNFTGNNEKNVNRDEMYSVSEHTDNINFDDIKDVATITKESTISDLDLKTVSFDDLQAVDMTNNLPEVHLTSSDTLIDHAHNFLESSLDNISDSTDHIKNAVKKLIDIISDNIDS